MKYTANVTKVLQLAIHRVGSYVNGAFHVTDLPPADRVEIECEAPEHPCMMLRYTSAGEFCGDTRHESWAAAISQAAFEYGLSESDFVRIETPE